MSTDANAVQEAALAALRDAHRLAQAEQARQEVFTIAVANLSLCHKDAQEVAFGEDPGILRPLGDADRSVGPRYATRSVPAGAPSGSGATHNRDAHDRRDRMAITEKQLDANRRNAQHSTGPKTDAGKQASRLNAVTHGILAKHVVITAGDCREDEREFAEMLARLREQFKPVGTAEDLEVQEIARCYWRKARAARHEQGVIREKTMDMRRSEEHWRERDFKFQVQSGSISGTSSRVTQYLIKRLEKAKEITEQEKVAVDSGDILKNAFPGQFAHLGNANASPEDRRQLIAEIDETLGRLREAHEQDLYVESLNLESKISAAALPGPEVVTNLVRYETSIDRKLDRALARLERMQERRRATGGPHPTN